LDRYPRLVDDGELGDDLVDEIRIYRDSLRSFENPTEKTPKNVKRWDKKTFILKDVLDARQPSPPID